MDKIQHSKLGNFILGKKVTFNSQYKYMEALLTGELAFFGIFLYLVYIGIDYFNNSYTLFPIYATNIIVILIISVQLRRGKIEISKFILLSMTLISLYLFGTSYGSKTQSYFYYFPLILFAFTVYGYKARINLVFFILVSLILLYLELGFDYSIFPRTTINEELASLLKRINLLSSLIITIYIGYYFIRTSHLSEKYLMFRQEELNNLTQKLKESEYRYELAMRGTNAGLWDWDIVTDKIYHGPKWLDMLGYNEEEFNNLGINEVYNIIHPDDIDLVRKAVDDQIEKDIPYSVEMRIKNKNGKYEWFLDSGKTIRNEEGKSIRMVGSIINISHRKIAEEKIKKQNDLLEKANSELDRFVYITSHDLKAPLLSIQGLIHLAEISNDPKEVEMCLSLMKERIKGLENFIADIIDYSRNARSGVVADQINLKQMVDGIIGELIFVDQADRITIKTSIPASLNFISDDRRLNVILKNLIFNAIKYQDTNQAKPLIEIVGDHIENEIIIRIKDNGVGIEKEIHDKIFEMFYRASEKSTGSGLGLYIVKEMVSKLNGNIRVVSESGTGSEFIVTLPLLN